MSIEIDVLNGEASWTQAEPLLKAVWPREVVANLPWGQIACARPDLRVLIEAPSGGVVCHVGIHFRTVTLDGRKHNIGGIGEIATRADCRGRGYASIALNAAVQTMRDHEAVEFALLVCEPHNFAFYQARGWHRFRRRDPRRAARRNASASRPWRRLCSISPARRDRASSTYAACRGYPCG